MTGKDRQQHKQQLDWVGKGRQNKFNFVELSL